MAALLLAVSVAIFTFAQASPVEFEKDPPAFPRVDSVWLLDHNYSGYVYSAVKFRLLALRPDGLVVDELNLATKVVSKTYPLPLPGYRIGADRTGHHVTVVHNSYLTFIDVLEETYTTANFPYADVPVSGLVVGLTHEHETCGWIHIYESGSSISEIVCVDPTTGNSTKCYDQGGTYGYTSTTLGSPDGSYIYGLTSNGYIVKYYTPQVTPSPIEVPKCPLYQYYRRPNWGSFYPPRSAWFSYDDSRIFLDNGLTLTASSSQSDDLQEHGSFNGTFASQTIYWVDQDKTSSLHDVLTIQRIYDYTESMYKLVINRFSWPFLEGYAGHIDIPVPTTPSGFKVNTYGVGSQVYFDSTSTSSGIIAVVNYTLDNNLYGPGIAFISQ